MAHPNRLHRLRDTHAVPLLALTAFLAAGCSGLVGAAADGNVAAAKPIAPLPVDPNVPTPESVLGHAPGNQPVAYDALVRYLHALADATPRVTLTPYGESYEGRTLYYLTITSEANHARLAEIQAENAKLADPRKLAAGETAETIAGRLPAVAWLGYSIHGDELSSTDAAIHVAYELAARTDATMRQWRDDMVIHVDPLMNPDGRSRYLAQLEHLSSMVPNPDYQSMQHRGLWSAGRGNHYLFDLNRDWLMQAHPETRGRIQAVLSWNPHLVVDSHEMGGLETYLFSPPREPINTYIPAKVMDWRRRFSADQAKAFDRHGWSYYTREWNEEWYAGYTNSWTALLGIVSILYEQAGVDGTSVRQPAGISLTYAESVQHHIVSTMANLATLHANRREIVSDMFADRQWAVSDAGPYNETFLLPPSPDRSRQERFIDLMRRQGIEMEVAQAPVEAGGVEDVWHQKVETLTFPAGTLVIRSAQPHRRLLHGMLAFDPRMSTESLVEEREELERRGDTRIYDVTAWNLPMAYGLDAYWAERIGDVETAPPTPPRATDGPSVRATTGKPYGYLIDFADSAVYRLVGRLLERGAKLRVATRAFTIGDRAYSPGAILLRGHENPADIAKILDEAADGLPVDITAVDTALSQAGPDLGAERFVLLQEPRIAVACQWPMNPQSFGSTWYWLDARIGLRVSLVNAQYLRHFDLRKYNVLVLPDAYGADALAGVLGDDGLKRLKTWVEAGGTLIAIGGAAQCL
ncbi:MAG: hypothetical protein JXA69_13270, partial [Phycisphaerae bacterium]|nr:hypothetical protein [Phycisphaerae bacterium]